MHGWKVLGLFVILWCMGACAPALSLVDAAPKRALLQEDVSYVNANQYGAGLDATTLNAAIAALGTTNKATLFLSAGIWNVASNVTMPINITLWIPSGTTVTINSSMTLTVHGPLIVDADNVTWHSGGGTFVWDYNSQFSPIGASAVNAKTCGAKVDGVTDDTVALNLCLATYTHVFIPAGILTHSGTIVINVGNRLSGVAIGLTDTAGTSGVSPRLPGSTLRYTGTGDAIAALFTVAVNCQCTIENILIRSTTGAVGIHLKNVADAWIFRVAINGQDASGSSIIGNTTAGLWLDGTAGGCPGDCAMITTRITDSWIYGNVGVGILVQGVNNTNAIGLADTRIQGNGSHGLFINARARGWSITGGDMEGNGGNQLRIDKGEAISITGAYFESSATATNSELIWLRLCNACSIQGNTIQGSTAALMAAGLRIGDTASGYVPQGLTIASNYFNNVASGIALDAGYGVTIRNNVRGPVANVTRELGGSFGVVEGLDYQKGRILNDASPGVTTVETLPVLQSMTTTIAGISNTTTETVLYTAPIRAYSIASAGKFTGGLELSASGSIVNNSGVNRDVTIRIKYGAATVGQLKWLALPSGAVRALLLRGTLTASTSFGVGHMLCVWEGDVGPTGSGAGNPTDIVSLASVRLVQICNASAAMTVAMSSDQDLTITAQMSAADVNFNIYIERAYVKRLPY